MASAIASEPFAAEKAAWIKLTPNEKEAVFQYHHALKEDCVTSIMTMEMIKIEMRVPDFCPVLSVPQRLLK